MIPPTCTLTVQLGKSFQRIRAPPLSRCRDAWRKGKTNGRLLCKVSRHIETSYRHQQIKDAPNNYLCNTTRLFAKQVCITPITVFVALSSLRWPRLLKDPYWSGVVVVRFLLLFLLMFFVGHLQGSLTRVRIYHRSWWTKLCFDGTSVI